MRYIHNQKNQDTQNHFSKTAKCESTRKQAYTGLDVGLVPSLFVIGHYS